MGVFAVDRPERRKKIAGFGGRYEVGDLGNVYSGGCRLAVIQRRYVNLSWKGVVTRANIGMLVARAFLPNPSCLQYVVHKDGDSGNNRVENLAWSEWKRRDLKGRILGVRDRRAVLQYTEWGELWGRYESLTEAADRTGIRRSCIKRVCDGEGRQSGGYLWRYE